MKSTNTNLFRKIKQFLTLCFIIFFANACVQKKDIIPPQAEIINIYNITDSSANVDVKVTKQSNAESGELGLLIDSLSITGSKIQVQTFSFNPPSGVAKLNDTYTTKISKLKSKTQYSISLGYYGVFDVGGPNEEKNFTIGTPKTFITN